MATYNLNEVLKEREAKKAREKKNDSGEKKLDDVTRVKVLSPGRQVFKRFIRNRLAVLGSAILIFMFVFSFLGPLVYPYGQTQIFYKREIRNVNYGVAKENATYNGYELDGSVELDHTVVNAMNSNIKSMIAGGINARVVFDNEGNAYMIKQIGHEVFTLGTAEATEIASVGDFVDTIGTFDVMKKAVSYEGDSVEGLDEAISAVASIKGLTADKVEVDGVEYTLKKLTKSQYEVTAAVNGTKWAEENLGEEFEAAMIAAHDDGSMAFEVDGTSYVISEGKKSYTAYAAEEIAAGRIYTRFVLMTYETGLSVSDDFKAQALYSAFTDGEFTVDGVSYKIAPNDDASELVINKDGAEFAEFTFYSVRRYSGADSMDYDLKKAVAEKLQDMIDTDAKEEDFVYRLPQQDEETGKYLLNDDGSVMYADSEMQITRSATGEYIIKADQITFLINIHESPSGVHILGTDGDGFDVLARIMYGGRISLMVGFIVVILETMLGVIMGGLAGYYGGWVDNLIMRLVDIFYCLPSMPIMIILGALMDALRLDTYVRLIIMMAMLGIMGWAGVARLVRGQILSLREQEFMIAAEATGIKVKHRIFRHLIPNVMPQLIVTATMGVGSVIITESTLSFLGLGVKHPLATWGTIINSVSSASDMAHYAFIWIPVGLLICLTVIAFNFVGDGLRDAYDPKAKR